MASSARYITNAPSYIDPPSFEETVMKTRSRSHSATSASYGIEHHTPTNGSDWDNEEDSKIDFPLGLPNKLSEYVYDDSDNSIEKNPPETTSDDSDNLSDHTQYSHLAPVGSGQTAAVNPMSSLVSSPASVVTPGQGNAFNFHHQLNLPTSTRSTGSRATPTTFGEMVHNRLSAQSEDENIAVNYATNV